jgi:hypothetical protein
MVPLIRTLPTFASAPMALSSQVSAALTAVEGVVVAGTVVGVVVAGGAVVVVVLADFDLALDSKEVERTAWLAWTAAPAGGAANDQVPTPEPRIRPALRASHRADPGRARRR